MDDAIPSRGGGFVAAEGLGEAAVAGDCGGVVVAEGGYGLAAVAGNAAQSDARMLRSSSLRGSHLGADQQRRHGSSF